MLNLKTPASSGVRMYDVANDAFITDRASIIDSLVASAARLLTFSERDAPTPYWLCPASKALLRRALDNDGHHGVGREWFALRHVVQMGWRAWVEPA